jgi:ubiquinone/menaquinone biosynthesis C-methylase UbiE
MDTSHDCSPLVPNHHCHYPGFSGLTGWIAALTMSRGRTDNAELAIDLTKLTAGERVVDIGCGPGAAARLSAELGAHVTGIDPASVMLRVARKADRHHAVTWRQGTAEALPLPDGSHDVAWSLSTVHHWGDLDAGLAEVRRVLTPHGRFVATERLVKFGATGHAGHGWTTEQADRFAELCESAGLHRVTVSRHHSARGELLAVLASAHS